MMNHFLIEICPFTAVVMEVTWLTTLGVGGKHYLRSLATMMAICTFRYLYFHLCVCIYLFVCAYICVLVCTYICVCLSLFVCWCVCVFLCRYICVFACVCL